MIKTNPAVADLPALGIVFDGAQEFLPRVSSNGTFGALDARKLELAMDAVTASTYAQPGTVTAPNAGIMSLLTTYIDPKLIEVLLAPTEAENIYGATKKGDWVTQTAAFGMIENTGEAASYGDFNESGRSDMNVNWPQRQSYNFQTFTEWGDMELERYALARVDAAARKNISSANTLNRMMNLIAFYGVSGLQNYGALNDPNLAAALTPATKAAGGTSWSVATPTEIIADIQAGYASLQQGTHGTAGNINLKSKMTLALSPVSETYLVTPNSFGLNAMTLLRTTFPNMEVKTAVQFQSGSTYSYQLFVDEIEGQRTMETAFNEKMRAHRMVMATSSMRQKKSAGSWGTIVYRPIGVASMAGI